MFLLFRHRSLPVRRRRRGQSESDRIVVAMVSRVGTLLQAVGGPTHEQHGGLQLEDRCRDAQSYVGDCRNAGQRTPRVSFIIYVFFIYLIYLYYMINYLYLYYLNTPVYIL